MLGFEKIADWWDAQYEESDKIMQEWVNDNNSELELHAKAVVSALGKTAMVLGAGIVDVLRLGEGVSEGGAWGYAQDGFRLLALAGPVAKMGRLGFAKWTVDPGGGLCASVTTAKALRHTGSKLFVRASEVFAATGGVAPTNLNQFIPFLRGLGVTLKEVSVVKDMNALKTLVQNNAKSVVMFTVKWTPPSGKQQVGHALYAYMDSFGKFKIADRTGKIVSSLKELDMIGYSGIASAETYSSAIIIYNSMIIRGGSLLSMLAVEVNAVMSRSRNEKQIILSPVDVEK